MNDINRSVIICYLSYKQRSSPGTRATRISDLAVFFEAGTINKWFNLSPYLIRKEDYPQIPKCYSLHSRRSNVPTKSTLRRTPRVCNANGVSYSGMRTQRRTMPAKLLETRCKGGWFIQFMRWKVKTETTIPSL